MRKIDWSARLRSKEFIVAIAALLGMIANSAFGITPEEWNIWVALVSRRVREWRSYRQSDDSWY